MVIDPTIDSRQLRAFVAVARRGSFTHGARDVFVTQSAASHAIKALEDELGCALFKRVGKRAVLTPAGERLLRASEDIFRHMGEVRSDLRAIGRQGQARLRIGVPQTYCEHVLPGILKRLCAQHPDCLPQIQLGDTRDLESRLLENEFDLAFTVGPARQPTVQFTPLFEDQLSLIVPAGHAWAARAEVSPANFQQETLLVASQATQSFILIEDWFRRKRLPLTRFIEVGSVAGIKELVKQGLGVGVVAPWTVSREIEQGVLVARSFPVPVRRRWGVVSRVGTVLNETEQALVSLAREIVPAGSCRVELEPA